MDINSGSIEELNLVWNITVLCSGNQRNVLILQNINDHNFVRSRAQICIHIREFLDFTH